MSAPVLIMAGGTGGHVFPAMAVARVLQARQRNIVWLGTRRGIEARLVPAAGLPIEWIEVGGLRGKGLMRWLAAPISLLRALWQAHRVLQRQRPGVVLGCGGFASGPGGIAAWLHGTPLVIHEQNAVAGMTNRWLARVATRVAEAFPGSFASARRAECIGNPVRADIALLPPPAVRFAGREGALRVLVFGGSQGARALNRLLPQALALAPASMSLQVLHQCGEQDFEATAAGYRAAGVTAELRPFIDDMASAYGWADLVVCRAGALTIAELAATGVAALLVPFPGAVDDHQTRNAQLLVQAGAAVHVAEAGLDGRGLWAQLQTLMAGGRSALLRRAEAARAMASVGSAERLAELCLAAERGAP